MNKSRNKGITLIALVITIIVMLILVGVTINLSLNGGLFGYAKQAVSETNRALSDEEMLSKGFIKEKDEDGKIIWNPIISNSNITLCPEADEGKWEYIHNGDGTITLTKYTGNAINLVVPNRYPIENNVYGVVSKVQNGDLQVEYNNTYGCDIMVSGTNTYNIIGNPSEVTSNIETVKISDGVKIGALAFYKMSSLTTVELGKNITIGASAFQQTGITELKIGAGIEKINLQAFLNCTSLTQIDLSGATNLEKIGLGAFARCTELVGEIVIPSKVKEIESNVFSGSNKITSLNLSKATSLETIGKSAFMGFNNLTEVDFSGATSLKNIGAYAFCGCTNITDLNLDKAILLENIGAFAFEECSKIKGELIFPASLKQIGEAAFQKCKSISNIKLNEGLEFIGNYAFNHSGSYTGTITIPSTVKQIGGQTYTGSSETYGTHMFYDCGNYTAFEVAEGNTAYKAIDGVLYNKSGTILIAYPQGKSGNTYEIPEEVTKINELALGKKKYLETIKLPDSYEIISTDEMPKADYKINAGNNLSIAIYQWGIVKSVEVKETNTKYKSENGMVLSKNGKILYYIPLKNAGEGTVTIPDTVEEIYKGAIFECNNSATKIVIPASCTEINKTDLQTINRRTWTIEVAEGNTKYTVTNGKLVTK